MTGHSAGPSAAQVHESPKERGEAIVAELPGRASAEAILAHVPRARASLPCGTSS